MVLNPTFTLTVPRFPYSDLKYNSLGKPKLVSKIDTWLFSGYQLPIKTYLGQVIPLLKITHLTQGKVQTSCMTQHLPLFGVHLCSSVSAFANHTSSFQLSGHVRIFHIEGWWKSSFRFFHNILWKIQTNFLASPILATFTQAVSGPPALWSTSSFLAKWKHQFFKEVIPDCIRYCFIGSTPNNSLPLLWWKWKVKPRGLYSPWNSPGQNIGVGSLSLFHGIFPTQGSNPSLPHCRRLLYQLSYQGSRTALVHSLFGNWRLFLTKYSPKVNKHLFLYLTFLSLSFLVLLSPLYLDCLVYQNLFSEQTHILSVMVFPLKKNA